MNKSKKRITIISLFLVIVILLGIGIIVSKSSTNNTSKTVTAETKEAAYNNEDLLKQAKIFAQQYDYARAKETIQKIKNYEKDDKITELLNTWENEESQLVEYPHNEITHVFVHSLIYDTSLAFDGDAKQDGYNLVMTTVKEFNEILNELYQRDFVLINLHDMNTFDEQHNRQEQTILLPPNKKAMIISQDDLCYYHSQAGDGIADKLIFDENGDIKCHYTGKNGEEIGDFDMVPIIDTFVKEHPDFSYHGHKGCVAVTGYNGVFGYRTDTVYRDKPEDELDIDQKQFLEANPNFDYNKEVEEAKKISQALKDTGWEIASHSWGHRNYGNYDLEIGKEDNEKFQERVTPIIGKTDIILYPNGSDIAGLEEYTSDNEKYNYLKNYFNIYCTVDSSMYWVQEGPTYMRMGRRNLDGYRMYHNPDKLEDLFDVDKVFDKTRPTPVPDMSHYG